MDVASPPTLTPNITLQNPLPKDSNSIIILGLDLALNCSGYSVLGYLNGKVYPVEIGHFTTCSEQMLGERLSRIESCLLHVLNSYPTIQVVCKERGFSKYNNVTSLLNQVLGVCVLTLYKNKLEIVGDYPPKTVKKEVSGSGNSTKTELKQSLPKYVDLPKGFEFTNEDESDSVAVALTYLIKQNLIETPIK